jgi:hypothetical protein
MTLLPQLKEEYRDLQVQLYKTLATESTSAHKKRTSALCSSLVQIENGAAIFSASLQLTASKVMLSRVSTRHLKGFNAANCHESLLYLMQTTESADTI